MNKDQLAELHRLIDDWAAKQPSLTVGGMLTSVPSTRPRSLNGNYPKING
jgi:hypothetical protein